MNSLVLQGTISRINVKESVTDGVFTFFQGYGDKAESYKIGCAGFDKPVRDVMGGLSESIQVVATGKVKVERSRVTMIINRLETV